MPAYIVIANFFQHNEIYNEINHNISITALRNFYFQVLLVRINIFQVLIATFNVLLHTCIILLGC